MKRFSFLRLFAGLFLLASTGLPAHAAKASVIPYPLDVCIVTDNDLGSMGDEQRFVYEGREIKFCCKPCEAKFLKNPARYLKKLEPAPAGEKPKTEIAPATPPTAKPDSNPDSATLIGK